MDSLIKPKNQRVKRFLKLHEPKLIENEKTTMILRGQRVSQVIDQVLKELYQLKKPEAVLLKKKNSILPFEDDTSLEFFSKKNDASLFLFGSHSKKRPNNIVIGRLYDHHLLDMFELGVEEFKSLHEFKTEMVPLGTKPCLLFAGAAFTEDPDITRLRNLFIDFFRGPVVTNLRLKGLQHVLMFTAEGSNVYLRSYRILLKKSGLSTPRIELEEMGPSVDLVLRRNKLASDDLFKRACRQPKEIKVRKTKNISRDPFGTKLGRVHMQQQDLSKLQTRKLKALKRTREEKHERSFQKHGQEKRPKIADNESTDT